MRAGISTVDTDEKSLLEKVLASPEMTNRELAGAVTIEKSFVFPAKGAEKFHVVAYDFGVKTNSLREFARLGCKITVVPAETSAAEVLGMKPDGIFLSNGPGDPAAMKKTVAEIEKLARENVPMFGICLGHQILGQVFGGETFKMKFGHRGGNQPIMDLTTGRVEIAAHNHGFAVKAESLSADVEVTHVNLNDKTVAGLRHKNLPIFSVQYHPESAPGPHDSEYLFRRFINLMEKTNRISAR
jgi:carbamoyl-phosphate synthase small subunit